MHEAHLIKTNRGSRFILQHFIAKMVPLIHRVYHSLLPLTDSVGN